MEQQKKQFDDGELTQLAIERTYEIDYNAADVLERGAAYIEEMVDTNFFLDNLKNYIGKNQEKLGFTGDICDAEVILDFMKKCYKNAGMIARDKGVYGYNPNMVKRWIMGEPIQKRIEAYRLCFCLRMNVVQATEFLFKGCLMKPFNFKDVSEAVYYFCLNTGRCYQDAVEIIQKIDNIPLVDNLFVDNDTFSIGQKIKEIKTEEELVSYISSNRNGFKEQSRKAISVLREQIEHSVSLAEWERASYFADYQISKIESGKDVTAILNVILGYEARANEQGQDVYKEKISKSNFPKLIKSNFPQPQQIVSILKQVKPSEETLRKAIVLWVFYNYFAELKKNKVDYSGGIYFDEFASELDSVLEQCGYIQMYWRHPYDWMFGYCAGAEEPLDELRELISYFYLDDEDNYLKCNYDLQEDM